MPASRFFLSYATEDAGDARALAAGLRAAGLDLWSDAVGDMTYGEELRIALTDAIEGTTGALFLCGARGATRWQGLELSISLAVRMRRQRAQPPATFAIVPIRLPDVPDADIPLELEAFPVIRLDQRPVDMTQDELTTLARQIDPDLRPQDAPPPPPSPPPPSPPPRSHRRLITVAATTSAAVLAIALTWVHLTPAPFTGGLTCRFRGLAREVSISGSGRAVIARPEAFSGDNVERVSLGGVTIGYDRPAKRVTWEPTGAITLHKPRGLLLVGASTDHPFHAAWRLDRDPAAGDALWFALRRPYDGNPGTIAGADRIDGGTDAMRASPWPKDIQWDDVLTATSWLASSRDERIPIADRLGHLERVRLGDAHGTLTCDGHDRPLDGATLLFAPYPDCAPDGSAFADREIQEVVLTRAGFELGAAGCVQAWPRGGGPPE